MKQTSIIALFLGAILVLTLSSVDTVFADSDEKYEQSEEGYEKENEREHEQEYHSETRQRL